MSISDISLIIKSEVRLRICKFEAKFSNLQIDSLKQTALLVEINKDGTLNIKTNIIDFYDLPIWAKNYSREQWEREFLTPEINRVMEHLGGNIKYTYYKNGWIAVERVKHVNWSKNSSYLTYINPYTWNNEFYLIDINNNSVKIQYGRIGSEGKTITKNFPNRELAIIYYEEQVQEKLDNGYE